MIEPVEEAIELVNKFYEVDLASNSSCKLELELARKYALICANIISEFLKLDEISCTKEVKALWEGIKTEIKNNKNYEQRKKV